MVTPGELTLENIEEVVRFDLTGAAYHGGTSLSSGALPKWDLLGKRYMVKRCAIDAFGENASDFANECAVYDFCRQMGIPCVPYRPIHIRYFDTGLSAVVECPAVLTTIWPGELIHYRTVRKLYGLGSRQDELLDFKEKYPAASPVLNAYLLVDLLFNQSDRHGKNLGMQGDQLFPLFDSGACLNFDTPDVLLNDKIFDKIPRHRTFGKPVDELLRFSLRYVEDRFCMPLDLQKLSACAAASFLKYRPYYSETRFAFITKLVERRVSLAGEICALSR
jgi:hypothetical protein